MKRFFLLLTCICINITMSARLVFQYTNIDDEAKTCYISKSGTDYIGEIEIPELVEIDNRQELYTVIGIDDFRSCAKITRVTLPSTIKLINDFAFQHCNSLSRINFPNGLRTIGENAFSSAGLEEIIIPNSVTKIGKMAFYNCTKLKNVYIGEGIQVLGNYEFVACNSLEKFVVGNGLTRISSDCFVGGSTWYAPSVFIILSNKLESCSFKGAQAIYVQNPENYAKTMPTYRDLFKPIAEIVVDTITYSGHCPTYRIETEVELEMTALNESLATDAGSYSDSVQVAVSYDNWNGVIKLPCAYTIKKAPITIIPNNASIYYGENIPDFDYTGIGFVNNETNDVFDNQPTLMTTATAQSDAGTYPIIALDAVSKNYEISYEKGVLTILKAPQTITWEPNFSGARIGEMIELSATSSSDLNVKFKSLDLSTAIITTNNGKSYVYPIKEGTVVIAAYQDGDKNYEPADEVYNILTISSADGIMEIKNDDTDTIYDLNGTQTDLQYKGVKIVKSRAGKYKKVI